MAKGLLKKSISGTFPDIIKSGKRLIKSNQAILNFVRLILSITRGGSEFGDSEWGERLCIGRV